jgi:hypothetical protein
MVCFEPATTCHSLRESAALMCAEFSRTPQPRPENKNSTVTCAREHAHMRGADTVFFSEVCSACNDPLLGGGPKVQQIVAVALSIHRLAAADFSSGIEVALDLKSVGAIALADVH